MQTGLIRAVWYNGRLWHNWGVPGGLQYPCNVSCSTAVFVLTVLWGGICCDFCLVAPRIGNCHVFILIRSGSVVIVISIPATAGSVFLKGPLRWPHGNFGGVLVVLQQNLYAAQTLGLPSYLVQNTHIIMIRTTPGCQSPSTALSGILKNVDPTK